MEAALEPKTTMILSDQDDPGELNEFVQGVKELKDTNGIVISVRASKNKTPEIRSVMEQSGATEIIVSDKQSNSFSGGL